MTRPHNTWFADRATETEMETLMPEKTSMEDEIVEIFASIVRKHPDSDVEFDGPLPDDMRFIPIEFWQAAQAAMQEKYEAQRAAALDNKDWFDEMKVDFDKALAEVARLRKALGKFGNHKRNCEWNHRTPMAFTRKLCTCGLDKALSTI